MLLQQLPEIAVDLMAMLTEEIISLVAALGMPARAMWLRPEVSAASGPANSIRGEAIITAVTSGRGLTLEQALAFPLATATVPLGAADMWMVSGDFFRHPAIRAFRAFGLNLFDAHTAIGGGHMNQWSATT